MKPRSAGMAVLVAGAVCVSAAPAAASTFYVTTAGNNGNDCATPATPCQTIAGAITRARTASDAATINVGPGTFPGNVALNTTADGGTAIVGAGSGAGGTVIQGANGAPAVQMTNATNNNSLAHVKVINSAGGSDDVINAGTNVTLTDVAVDVHNGGGPATANGVSSSLYPVVFDSGSVTMENGSGSAFAGSLGALAVRSSTVSVMAGATASGITQGIGPLTVSGTTVNVAASGATAIQASAGSAAISDTTVTQAGTSGGILTSAATAQLSNVTITMTNAASTQFGYENAAGQATLDHVTVAGAWHGFGVIGVGNTTIRDSRLTTPAGSTSAVAEFVESGAAGRSTLVQRSIFQQGSSTTPNAIVLDADLVLDSSVLLGGQYGVLALHSSGKPRSTAIIGSTIDVGTLGSRDGAPAASLYGNVSGPNNSAVTMLAQGSILLEAQQADVAGAGNSVTITCTASDAPDQTQAADATHGAINCASGANGNAATDPLPGLFAGTPPDYGLNPSSSGVDGVPDAVISPPAGVTLSSTDLAGNPRNVDGTGNCVALRDKGAVELQGHAGIVPAPAIAGPAGGVAGTPITLTASAPNEPAGTAVTYSWVFTGPSVGTGATVTPTFTTAGPATAAVTASAGDACTATATKQLTITAAVTVDQITKLKVTPNAFFAASSGASIAAAKKTGATVSYVGTQPATTLFRVQRKARGRKVGKRCVKATKKNASKKPCSRYLTVGSFSHTDAAAGAIHFRFRGRVKNKKLTPGRYRLRAVPTNSAGAGHVATAAFRIKK